MLKVRDVVIDIAHGMNPGSNIAVEVITWYKWIKERQSWEEAKVNCEEMGGKLFYKVNGSKIQLDWLSEKFVDTCHWLGIFTENHMNVFPSPVI